MKETTPGPWSVKNKHGAIGVFSGETPLAMVMPQGGQARDTQEANAYLLAAAPQLFEVCQKLQVLLENSLIVTPEGIKINDSDLRQSLREALLRAGGNGGMRQVGQTYSRLLANNGRRTGGHRHLK